MKTKSKIDTANVSMTIEVAMGYIEMGQYKKALEHLEVAQRLLIPEEESRLKEVMEGK